nr:RecQ-mediated genome instability protein 1 isoform X1 [Tanacetum cinerariifolium]
MGLGCGCGCRARRDAVLWAAIPSRVSGVIGNREDMVNDIIAKLNQKRMRYYLILNRILLPVMPWFLQRFKPWTVALFNAKGETRSTFYPFFRVTEEISTYDNRNEGLLLIYLWRSFGYGKALLKIMYNRCGNEAHCSKNLPKFLTLLSNRNVWLLNPLSEQVWYMMGRYELDADIGHESSQSIKTTPLRVTEESGILIQRPSPVAIFDDDVYMAATEDNHFASGISNKVLFMYVATLSTTWAETKYQVANVEAKTKVPHLKETSSAVCATKARFSSSTSSVTGLVFFSPLAGEAVDLPAKGTPCCEHSRC